MPDVWCSMQPFVFNWLVHLFSLFAAAMPRQWKKKCCRRGCMNAAASLRAGFCSACFKQHAAAPARKRCINVSLPLSSWEKFHQKCSTCGCRNDAASRRARFCTACFKKNAAAFGRLRGNPEKGKKKCSGHGCRNDVQDSR